MTAIPIDRIWGSAYGDWGFGERKKGLMRGIVNLVVVSLASAGCIIQNRISI